MQTEYKRSFISGTGVVLLLTALIQLFAVCSHARADGLIIGSGSAQASVTADPRPVRGDYSSHDEYVRAVEEWIKRQMSGAADYSDLTLAEAHKDFTEFYLEARTNLPDDRELLTELLAAAVELSVAGESAPGSVSVEHKLLMLQIRSLGLHMVKDLTLALADL